MAATIALRDCGGLSGTSFPKVRALDDQQRHPEAKTSSDRCFLAARLLLPVAVVILVCSAPSAFAQFDSTKLVDPGPSGSYLVSKNQLLAPDKAVRATERAHKDMMSGHLESAQKQITRALEIAPHFGVAEALQGGVYLQAENFEEAAKFFQGAMDDDPALGAAHVGMGVIMMRQRRFQLALSQLDRAEALLPGAWFVHFAKAWDYLDLGNNEAALKQVEFAERIAGTDREKRSGASYLRAVMYIYMKDMDHAREYLAEAVARDPNGDYAPLAKKELERLRPLLAVKK